ncbi:MAG: hypothetical protein AAGA22_03270, partial [Pseudomonadota bacterium]
MRFGVFASFLLHASAIGLAFVSLPEELRTVVEAEPFIPVELIAEAEYAERTSVPAATPDPEPEPEPQEPEVEEPAPVEAEPEPVEAPEPEPIAPDPEPEPEPEEVTEPEPEP